MKIYGEYLSMKHGEYIYDIYESFYQSYSVFSQPVDIRRFSLLSILSCLNVDIPPKPPNNAHIFIDKIPILDGQHLPSGLNASNPPFLLGKIKSRW